MLFSKQLVYCNICGKEFSTTFQEYEGRFCGTECWKEFEWRTILSVMGKTYYPRSQEIEKVTNN